MSSGRKSLPRRSATAKSSGVSINDEIAPENNSKSDQSTSSQQSKKPQQIIPLGPAPVAIDLGSFSLRISIGWDVKNSIITQCPNAIVKQQSLRRHNKSTLNGGGNGNPSSSLIGPIIHERCTNYASLAIRQPMDRGMVIDWQAQKAILDVALADGLTKERKLLNDESPAKNDKVPEKFLKGRQVIITESYFNLPDLQAAMDLFLLEEYGAASIWRCPPAYPIPYCPSLFGSSSSSGKKRQRPECMLIVDLGHSGTHTIPIVGDSIIWKATRRHVISQRLLTNLLKESLSFRQWDMMDEAWLVGRIKETCCFVAGSAGRRGDKIDLGTDPSHWSFAGLVELCESTSKMKNPIVQEYVLPDYADVHQSKSKHGFIRKGPGSEGTKSNLTDDQFIADGINKIPTASSAVDMGDDSSEGEGDDSDDDFDESAAVDDSDEDGETSSRPRKKEKKEKKEKKSKPLSNSHKKQEDEESDQVLILERERFQVPEVMFNPGIIGLDDTAPLQEVIRSSIEACDENVRGLMWANICLVGGGAKMRGIKTRLESELRPLAPSDSPLHIWTSKDPALTAIEGAQTILTSSVGTNIHRTLKSRLVSAEEYNLQNTRERFGSWNSI